jgi:hypothetical protein
VLVVTPVGYCPLAGAGATPGNAGSGTVWAEGNILLGGGGSDLLEGRGNNDIIDGDHALTVAISVRTNPADPATEIGRTDLMENPATSGNFGPASTPTMTLQEAIFKGLALPADPDGRLDPGNLVAVRQISMGATPNTGAVSDCGSAAPVNCDTALYSAGPDAYTITANANGSVTVADNAFVAAADLFAKGDGVDTLWNIENLRFCIGTDPVTKLCNAFTDVSVAPAAAVTPATLAFGNQGVGSTSTAQTITVKNTGIANLVVSGLALTGTDPGSFTATPAADCSSVAGGASCTITVQFKPTTTGNKVATVEIADNAAGTPHKVNLTGTGVAVAPSAPTIGTAVRANASGSATVNWSAPASNGGSAITGYVVQVLLNGTNTQVGALRPAGATATSLLVSGLTNGTAYQFRVAAVNAVGTSAFSALSTAVTPATVPGAPVIGNAANGGNGGTIEAIARWNVPAGTVAVSTGGSPITGYVVTALRMGPANQVLGQTVSAVQPATARQLDMTLPVIGNYRFTVHAINAIGAGPESARSNQVLGR